jgi:hypothetical protein
VREKGEERERGNEKEGELAVRVTDKTNNHGTSVIQGWED